MHREVTLYSCSSIYKHTEGNLDLVFSYISKILLRFIDKSTDRKNNSQNYIFWIYKIG